jgi:ESF2/ABP1 family protein
MEDTATEREPVVKKKSKLLKQSAAFKEKLDRRGVVYLARVPPYMKPNKAQAMFEEYGKVTRIFLQEEDPSYAKRRKAAGGNGSRQFREGWVEFEDKKLARRVAESLNNTPMGGKKSSFYHDDLWNLKYLKSFKWDNLTEMQACAKRASEAKLQAAMLQSKRQNAEFAELVEKNKVHKHVEERKRKRAEDEGLPEKTNADSKKPLRHFRQKQSISLDSQPTDKALLSNIFANREK